MLCVKCEDLDELKIYSNAVDTSVDMMEIYNIARNYGKYQEPTEENYYKMCDEIKEISFYE